MTSLDQINEALQAPKVAIPGPLLDAFFPVPDAASAYRLHPVSLNHIGVLERIRSPLVSMLQSRQRPAPPDEESEDGEDGGEAPEAVSEPEPEEPPFDVFDLFTALFVLTRPGIESKRLLATGAFAAAVEQWAEETPALALTAMSLQLKGHLARAMSTAVALEVPQELKKHVRRVDGAGG